MAYKIDNAIIKKDRNGRITLIDPDNVFKDEDAFIAVKSDFLLNGDNEQSNSSNRVAIGALKSSLLLYVMLYIVENFSPALC